MLKTLLVLFFIGHLLGDFYFQSSQLAEDKDESFSKLIKHSSIYLLSMLFVIIPLFSIETLKGVLIISGLHFFIDFSKSFIKKKIPIGDKLDVKMYFIDQAMHILIILFTTIMLFSLNETISYIHFIEFLGDSMQTNINNILPWILSVLIIMQPVSITIKKVLYSYKSTAIEEEYGHPNAGATIGILERSIILLMLSVGQYAAIGFVLTAKSIARYDKIADDPKFAEYYLLGTLLSTLLVILTYLIVF